MMISIQSQSSRQKIISCHNSVLIDCEVFLLFSTFSSFSVVTVISHEESYRFIQELYFYQHIHMFISYKHIQWIIRIHMRTSIVIGFSIDSLLIYNTYSPLSEFLILNLHHLHRNIYFTVVYMPFYIGVLINAISSNWSFVPPY